MRRDRLPTPVFLGFSCGSAGKESTCNLEDLGLIPELGKSPGEGKGYPLQYSGLESSMDCIVHEVAETQLSNFHFHKLKGLEVYIWKGRGKYWLREAKTILLMFPGGTFLVSLYALVNWLDPEFLSEPLQFLSDKAKVENTVRHLESLFLWIPFESPLVEQVAFLKEEARLQALLKSAKVCAHELTLLITLLLPRGQALPFEDVAKRVADESKVQKLNDSEYGLPCH